MALSNIFREPRREITETVVGLAIVGALIFGDYLFACWFEWVTGDIDDGCPWPLGMFIGVGLSVLLIFVTFAAHAIGEGICNKLESSGIYLRPRVRR